MRYMLRGMREHFRERVMLLLKEMGESFCGLFTDGAGVDG